MVERPGADAWTHFQVGLITVEIPDSIRGALDTNLAQGAFVGSHLGSPC
jgi:hypothetical protein